MPHNKNISHAKNLKAQFVGLSWAERGLVNGLEKL